MSRNAGTEIRLVDLNFGYGENLLFSEFDFCPRSNISIIEGYSGCGKTSLLKIINGFLIPENAREFVVADRSFLVVQEDALFPWLTGGENLRFFRGENVTTVSNRIYDEIQPLLDQPVYQMSYGQRRLVEISRALASNASALLLDEPFNFLDEANARMVWECLLEEVNVGRLVIISTHHHRDFVAGTEAEVFRFKGSPPWRRLERISNGAASKA